jgi:hypothetical protein
LQGQDGGLREKQMPQEVINLNEYSSYAECKVIHVLHPSVIFPFPVFLYSKDDDNHQTASSQIKKLS